MVIQQSKYRNASVVLVGIACMPIILRLLLCTDLPPYDQQWNIMTEVHFLCNMSTPLLFAWIGVMLRKRFPRPKMWIRIFLFALPLVLYVFWTASHHLGYYGLFDSYRYIWIMAGLIGYLFPCEQLSRYFDNKRWFELAITIGFVFVYVGSRQLIKHFTIANLQELEGEWARLFHRLMMAIPFAISIVFLICFSFSRIGQRMGKSKVFGWYTQIIATLYSLWVIPLQTHWLFSRTNLITLYTIVSTPVMVYLLVVLGRLFKRTKDGRKPFRDLFEEAPTVEQVHDSGIVSESSEKDLNIGTE